jgi:hypothetical protein
MLEASHQRERHYGTAVAVVVLSSSVASHEQSSCTYQLEITGSGG